ncbi:MAG TPA: alkylmercury lyase family protein [Streptosporangiaceae bacterium]|jgi:alkylmercury lyase
MTSSYQAIPDRPQGAEDADHDQAYADHRATPGADRADAPQAAPLIAEGRCRQVRRPAEALGLDPRSACAELAEADLVHLDQAGSVSVADPFSAVPSGHRVQLADGPSVWAMCAIDALGIPQMAGRDATITATDPHSGEPVRVEVTAGEWRWSPPSTSVLVALADTGDASALCACPHVNFHTSPDHARAYLAHHPELTGELLLAQHPAIEYAHAAFGALLHPVTGDDRPPVTTAR